MTLTTVRLTGLLVASVTYCIPRVSRWGIPTEVFETVVCGIIVGVTTNTTIRARPNERFQNQSMNFERVPFMIWGTKVNYWIAVSPRSSCV